jgi:hypothetical protein
MQGKEEYIHTHPPTVMCMGITRGDPCVSNEPKIIQIGPEMKEICLKQCLSYISFISGPIWMILGLLETHGSPQVIPVHITAPLNL